MCQFPSVYFVPYDLPSVCSPSFPLFLLAALSIRLSFLASCIGSMNADIIHVLSGEGYEGKHQVALTHGHNFELCTRM